MINTNKLHTKQQHVHRTFLFAGIITISLGVLYYFLFRPLPIGLSWFSVLVPQDWQASINLAEYIHSNWHYSIPSFLHVLSFSCLTLALMPSNKRNINTTGISWFIISAFFELSQQLTLIGNFDTNDLLAALLGSACFIGFSNHYIKYSNTNNQAVNCKSTTFNSKPLYLAPLFIMGVIAITGSYPSCNNTRISSEECGAQRDTLAEPIYMSYDELRSSTSIFTTTNSPLLSTGKIYVYEDHIFINSPNKGIHIYDNRDPSAPTEVAFINIPGNVDIAISQGYLYVDSYIDLVTIDIRDFQMALVVDRQLDVFPYDPYQNIPDTIFLTGIDERKGVIVGYNIL